MGQAVEVALDRDKVSNVLCSILSRIDRVDEREWRLVGTAATVLRGVAVEAADLDVLFRERSTVDRWFDHLSTEFSVEVAPTWLEEDAQYFTRIEVEGASVELSTVEIEAEGDTTECCGSGPWQHYTLIEIGDYLVPVVASELRLITEIARQRPDRYRPLMEHAAHHGCDVELIARGLLALGASDDLVNKVIQSIAPSPNA